MKRGAFAAISGTFLITVLVLTAIIPGVRGDGCYIPVKPSDIFESGQNAIIAWDGSVERLYLSVNIYAEKDTTGFHVVPFPSMPEITLGSLNIFKNHTRLLNGFEDRYHQGDEITNDGDRWESAGPAAQIVFKDVIGEHDVTVIRVNDVENFKVEMMRIVDGIGIDLRSWPEELYRIITNYTLDGCNYFSVDNYPIYKKEKTVDPLIYEFETDHLFFPLEISSMLEGDSLIRLALFTEPGIPLDRLAFYDLPRRYYNPYGELVSMDILTKIDIGLAAMFPEGACYNYVEFELPLSRVRGDLIIGRDEIVSWEIYTRSSQLRSSRISDMDEYPYPQEYRYDPLRTIIPDLGLCLLYNDYEFLYDRMLCMDLDDGSILWEWENPQDAWEKQIDSVSAMDIDNDKISDILVSYIDRENDSRVIVRLDPLTGEDIPINTSILDFLPEATQIFRDVNGTEYLALMSSFKMVVIDPETWELIAEMDRSEPNDKYGKGSIPLHDYIMHYWDGIGDGFYFFDGRCRWAWSPFYRMSDEELNRTGYIDDNIIYQFGFKYICELDHQGENYILATVWNSTHGYDICFIDMDEGEVKEYIPSTELWELRYQWDTLVTDHDNDGEDELIVVHQGQNNRSECIYIDCLDPVSKIRYWSTLLGPFEDMFRYEGIELIDLNDDGKMELVVHSEQIVVVLDISTGDIIRKIEGSRLLLGFPDLDRDGSREIITNSKIAWVIVRDPFDDHETLNFTTRRISGEVPIFYDDFNDDGYNDLMFYPSEEYSEGYDPIRILDGRTGDILGMMRMEPSPEHIEIYGEDGSYYMILEDHSRLTGVHLNSGLLEKLKENRTRQSITILPAEPGWDVMDTGYETPIVEIMVAAAAVVIVLGLYLTYMKWWKIRKIHL